MNHENFEALARDFFRAYDGLELGIARRQQALALLVIAFEKVHAKGGQEMRSAVIAMINQVAR